MTHERLYGKITSILTRLEWIDGNLPQVLVPGNESRLERLDRLAGVLTGELRMLLEHVDSLDDGLRLEIRNRMEALRNRKSIRQNLLSQSRLVFQGLFGTQGHGGYNAGGERETGTNPNLVRLTA